MADSKPRYPGLSIQLPVDQLTKSIEDLKDYLITHSHDMLEIVGVALLAKVQDAYIVKARGGTGSDGIEWAPIQLGTLLARMRRSGHLVDLNEKEQKQTDRARKQGMTKFVKLAKTNNANFEALRQGVKNKSLTVVSGGSKRGKDGKRAYQKGTIFGIRKDKKTGRMKEALQKTISPGTGGYEIGRDTGLQLISLQPGKGGNAGANITYEVGAVTVGAAMDYSEHFDKHRPIIPDHLPEDWMKEFDELLSEFGAKAIETEFEKI